LSTGERKLAELSAVLADANCQYLLLDEWDANLDAAHIEQMNHRIDAVAESKVVVEVRHR